MPRIKKKIFQMPDYGQSDDEQKWYVWGLENGINISPHGIKDDPDHWFLAVRTKSGWKKGKFKYDRENIWPEFYKAYKHYYDKARKDDE